MPTEQERRAAMYPELLSCVSTIATMLREYEGRGLHLDGDKLYILERAERALAADRRNVHVHPTFGPVLAAMSPAVPDPALVALVQSDVPSFIKDAHP